MLDNEVLWIEIRQNWSVARGYNDTGYLALQINMKPSGSQIVCAHVVVGDGSVNSIYVAKRIRVDLHLGHGLSDGHDG